jgi:hypothetical protein
LDPPLDARYPALKNEENLDSRFEGTVVLVQIARLFRRQDQTSSRFPSLNKLLKPIPTLLLLKLGLGTTSTK